MKRRGFFSRLLGIVSGLFGVGAAASARGDVTDEQPSGRYVFRSVRFDVVEPQESGLRDISKQLAWMLGYETGVLQQHLCRTESAFRMQAHPRNLERLRSLVMSKGRAVKRVSEVDSDTVEIEVSAYAPGQSGKIFDSRGGCWDNLVRTC